MRIRIMVLIPGTEPLKKHRFIFLRLYRILYLLEHKTPHMKNILYSLLILLCVPFASPAQGIKKRDLVQLSEKNSVQASYFIEHVATQPVYCVNFSNTGNTPVTFSWRLKNKDGKYLNEKTSITLRPGESVNGFDDPQLNRSMTFVLPESQVVS